MKSKKTEEAYSIRWRVASPDPIPLDERNVYRFDSRPFQIERLSFLETSVPKEMNIKIKTKGTSNDKRT